LCRKKKEALRTLKNDRNIVIVPADKGCATVVMNRDDYERKVEEHLNDVETYEKQDNDSTSD
jgi:hypothetical protein